MTQTLKQGDRGALVSLLQLGLTRAGQTPGALDGIFGAQTAAAVRAFQAASALTPDGIAGARTHRALLPYYTGFVTRTIRAGDTFSALARQYGTSVDAIRLANPYLDPERLPLGRALTIPLPFSVTPTEIPQMPLRFSRAAFRISDSVIVCSSLFYLYSERGYFRRWQRQDRRAERRQRPQRQ